MRDGKDIIHDGSTRPDPLVVIEKSGSLGLQTKLKKEIHSMKCAKCGGTEFIVEFNGELLLNVETGTYTIWDMPDSSSLSETARCSNPDCDNEVSIDDIDDIMK